VRFRVGSPAQMYGMKPLRFSFRKRAKRSSIRLCIKADDLIELR
jgi:hypothetical protein